jgi:RHS repeat-associated protein
VGVLGADQIESIQGPTAGSITTCGYDELGQISSRDIDGTTQTWQRDEIGRVTDIANALGHFVYHYDDLGLSKQVSGIDWPNGAHSDFSYAEPKGLTPPRMGSGTIPTPDVTLQRITHAGLFGYMTFEYGHDQMDRITNWTRRWPGQSDRYDFSYDFDGQLVQATRLDNKNNVLSQSGYTYDDAGNRVSEQTDTALTRSLFDESNTIYSTTGGGPVRFAGQLTKPAAITVNGVPADVDSRHRFEAELELSPGAHTVTLVATDPGNDTTVTHDYQVNVTAGNPRLFSRDESGNITSSTSPDGSGAPNATYEWDGVDRLAAINIGNHHTEIQYDGLGRRSKITEREDGNVTSEKHFVWFGNELCEEQSAGGSVTRHFFAQGEQRIGGADAGTYFYARDHLGSIREMTDATGNVRARYDYTPWGIRSKLSGDLDCDFGFTGFYFHNSSGLNFSRTRAYDAVAARWLSQDPIGELGGINLYQYAYSDPINYTDLLGLWGANEAYRYWFNTAVDGFSKGGFWGNAQAVAGIAGVTIIDAWGARTLENNAQRTGAASGVGCYADALKYGGLVLGQVVLAAGGQYAASNIVRPFYRLIGPGSRPGFGIGTWLTRGVAGEVPYGSIENAVAKLQIPAVSEVKEAVNATKKVWWRYIAGPRRVSGNPQFGPGGGAEYRVGGFGD